MGSLTQSLLSSSADKTAEAADYSKNLQDSSNSAPAQSSMAQKPAAQKAIEGGEKKAKQSIISGAKKVLGAFKEGGTVPKTGIYKLHEGEEVIPTGRASEYRKVYLGRKSKKD